MCVALAYVEERVVAQQVDASQPDLLATRVLVDEADEVGGKEAVGLAAVDVDAFIASLGSALVLPLLGAFLFVRFLAVALVGYILDDWCIAVVVEQAVELK